MKPYTMFAVLGILLAGCGGEEPRALVGGASVELGPPTASTHGGFLGGSPGASPAQELMQLLVVGPAPDLETAPLGLSPDPMPMICDELGNCVPARR